MMLNQVCNLDSVNMLATIKDDPREHYLIVWSDGRTREALQQLGRWAANEELSFTWFDAATQAQRIRTRLGATE